MARAARTHGVPLGVLYAVGLSETGRKGVLNPYALNIDGKTVLAADLRDAVAQFRRPRARAPSWSISAACKSTTDITATSFASVEAMFDPARNVDYAARFLKELRAREGNWTMAVARYNAGPNNTIAQRRYICSVIGSLVASGFGSWTSNARTFCSERASL